MTLGVGSLFVYWVHVELVYGFATRPLRRNLTLEQCAVAWAAFSLAMYALLLSWNASRPTRHRLREEARKALQIRQLDPETARRSVTEFLTASPNFGPPVEIPGVGRYNAGPLELPDQRTATSP